MKLPKPPVTSPDRSKNWHVSYWLFAVFAFLAMQYAWQGGQLEAVPYSEFEKELAAGNVSEVTIGEQAITGKLKTPHQGKTALVATRVEPDLAERLDKYNVPYKRVLQNNFIGNLISWVAPAAVFFALWYFFIRKMAEKQGGLGGFMTLGRSRAKVYMEQNTGVRFADVAGVDEAKDELRELVDFLRSPADHGRLGGRMPKGVLLVGPPGTGKTLLARAVAGEAGVPFFSISGSDFVEMFVGVGAARVRDLFEQARQKAPAIVFIDELDAMGRARGAFATGSHDEKEQTLNQLLTEMDGFDPLAGVIIIAATNRPEVLDPALLRAGRFDRQVLVDRPDRAGREQILAVHARKIKLEPGLQLAEVAALTAGFSGADLENLVNEAALAATRRGADAVTLPDFTVALERIVAGLEKKKRVLSGREREVVAYHEMGHALVALGMPGSGETVHKVSIIPRGIGALGYTMQRPTEDRYLMTREELERKVAVLLAGRAAEHLVFGHLSTGAADDLARATSIAQDMVMRYGMEPTLGHVSIDRERSRFLESAGLGDARPAVSEATLQRVDEAVRSITQRGFAQARALLATNREVLEKGARDLLDKETLQAEELDRLARELKPVVNGGMDEIPEPVAGALV